MKLLLVNLIEDNHDNLWLFYSENFDLFKK